MRCYFCHIKKQQHLDTSSRVCNNIGDNSSVVVSSADTKRSSSSIAAGLTSHRRRYAGRRRKFGGGSSDEDERNGGYSDEDDDDDYRNLSEGGDSRRGAGDAEDESTLYASCDAAERDGAAGRDKVSVIVV